MLANLLILLGITALGAGLFLKFRSPASEPPVAAHAANPDGLTLPVVADTSERKGYDFEKWVVSMFNRDAFVLKEWQGDKIAPTGKYAENNKNPDLVFELKLGPESYPFAVECKWRSEFRSGVVELGYPDQLERYRTFSRERRTPVFIVLGLGGTPDAPEQLFVVPLDKAGQGTWGIHDIAPFRKPMVNSSFFYDLSVGDLKI